MILGTWNLEGVASPTTARGLDQIAELVSHQADVWFLTEVQETLQIPGMQIVQSPGGKNGTSARRWSAIATHWNMEPVPSPDHAIACLFSMAHLTDRVSGVRVLAVTSMTPWRSAASLWREYLKMPLGHADLCDAFYLHLFDSIEREIRSEEHLVWGGDFNQALTGRDYVGTSQNRATVIGMMETLGLQAPTMTLSASR